MQRPMPASISEEAFAAFFDLYHLHTSDADLAANSDEVQRAATRDHLMTGATRLPGEVVLRIINPNLEVDGWGGKHTVVQLVMDDMPFVVDSLTAAMSRLSRGLVRVLHPVLPVVRDAKGEIQSVGEQADARLESWCEFVIQRVLTPAAQAELEQQLRQVIGDIEQVNADWAPMRECALRLAADAPAGDDTGEFLRWIADGNFTFLGYRYYELDADQLVAVPTSGLGLLNGKPASITKFDEMSPHAKQAAHSRQRLVIAKSAVRSTVHRAVRSGGGRAPVHRSAQSRGVGRTSPAVADCAQRRRAGPGPQ